MISLKEIITSNIDKLSIIDPFSFKYITPTFINFSTLKFNINIDYYPTSEINNYYLNIYFSISIVDYIKILEKIFTNDSRTCYICKKINIANFCCNLCYEWLCDSCIKLHSEENPLHHETLKKFNFFQKTFFEMKFFTLDNIQKDWKICECKKGGGEIIYYCIHGLKCKNCLCNFCNNDYEADYVRFFHLDLLFLESELKNYKKDEEIEQIKNYIKQFNDKIAKLFLINVDKIKKESRKKRFKKHFYELRKNFIAYFKLKMIVLNILQKNKNYNLIQLFKKQKYFKIVFKEFKFDEFLDEYDNISKLSNYFATKKPIFFVSKKIKEKPYLIKQYLSQEGENKKKLNKKNKTFKKCELSEGYFLYNSEDINEFKNYANGKALFNFYKGNNINNNIFNNIIYSMDFSGKLNNINIKSELLFNSKKIPIRCKPIIKLENGRFIFQIFNGKNNWICFLNESKFNSKVFELEHATNAGKLKSIFKIKKKNKILLYENFNYDLNLKKIDKISILDLYYPYEIKYNAFKNLNIDNKFFILKNLENILLIPCIEPYLNLIMFDYELNQVNTIIELIKPIMPRDNFYEIVPYIYDIKELKNNKLLFYGKQRYERDYPPSFSYKYKFKIIYNYNNFEIELAENEIEYNDWG